MSLGTEPITLGGEEYTFNNPNLVLKPNKNTYTLSGEIEKYKEDLSAWGFNPPTDYIVPLVLTVDGADDNATVELRGTYYNKKLTRADFDTNDSITLVLNGMVKNYTITVQATTEQQPVVLTVMNQAVLEP